MKFSLLILLVLASTSLMAKEVKDFNRVLIEDVKKDIRNDNAEDLKTKNTASRGPASVVENEDGPALDESKIDKTVRQLGANKW